MFIIILRLQKEFNYVIGTCLGWLYNLFYTELEIVCHLTYI